MLQSLSNSIQDTNGRTDGRTNAGNRTWYILALKCDVWWQ